MDLVTVGTQLATILGTVSGMRETHATEPDTIGATPAAVVLDPTGDVVPGNRQVTTLTQPVRVYYALQSDSARTSTALRPFVDACVAALALHSSQTGVWTEIQRIRWSFQGYAVAGEMYLAIDFQLTILIREVATYAAA